MGRRWPDSALRCNPSGGRRPASWPRPHAVYSPVPVFIAGLGAAAGCLSCRPRRSRSAPSRVQTSLSAGTNCSRGAQGGGGGAAAGAAVAEGRLHRRARLYGGRATYQGTRAASACGSRLRRRAPRDGRRGVSTVSCEPTGGLRRRKRLRRGVDGRLIRQGALMRRSARAWPALTDRQPIR